MKSYFKFLSRNKLFTFIQFFGLSVSLGVVLLLVSYVHTEYSVKAKTVSDQPVYAVGGGEIFGMPNAFLSSVPEVTDWTTIGTDMKFILQVGDDYYNDVRMKCVGPNFFQFFDYELEGCSREESFTNTQQAILSRSFARKLFGNENPIGKNVILRNQDCQIVGVVEDFTDKDVFQPTDMFISIKFMEQMIDPMEALGVITSMVHLKPGTDKDLVADKLLKLYKGQWPEYHEKKETGNFAWGSELVSMDDVYLCGKIGPFRSGNKDLITILLIGALVLLISAIFNYANLAMVQTGKRAKEMSIRRLHGESSLGIICRYLSESAMMTLGCFVTGACMAFLLCPFFNDILNTQIHLYADWSIIILTVAVLIIVAVLCGILPAMMVARFSPIDVIKGSFRFQSKMVLNRIFIGIQCLLCTIFIAVSGTMFLQTNHLVNLPLGYDTADLLKIESFRIGRDYESQYQLKTRLETLPEVEAVGLIDGTPIHPSHLDIKSDEEESTSSSLAICILDTTALRLFGFNITEQYSDLLPHQLLVSERGKEYYQLNRNHTGIGGSSTQPQYTACGIVADYHYGDAMLQPGENDYNALEIMGADADLAQLLVKTRGDHEAAMAAIRKVCKDVVVEKTGIPYDIEMEYLDNTLYSVLREPLNVMKLVTGFMLMSILISAMGMFGMAVYYSDQQRKVTIVHRIMGASVQQAVTALSRPFVITSAVAVVIAIPISYQIMQYYLEGYFYRISFPWWVLAFTVALILLITLICVVGQTLKVATANPAESIKAE